MEQRQVRMQRRKRKERDATVSGTPGVPRIVTDVLAQLGYATEPVVQRRVVTDVQVKGKEPVIEEAAQEELWEEEEPVSQRLTKAQRKARNLAQGGQGSGKAEAPQALTATPLNIAVPSSSTSPSQGGVPSYGQWPWPEKKGSSVEIEEFRLWQEKKEPPIGVEEVTQEPRGGSKGEELIIIESDDENEEERMKPLSVLLGKVEDLLDKMGRYQHKLVGLCEEVRKWKSSIPKVFLYDSGPESAPGRPEVNVVGSCPPSGMMGRPLTPQARRAQAARTRNQARASASQEPLRREKEPGKRKEAVEVEDDDNEEEEDERLRKGEDQRAEQRARKKGARGEVEPVVRDGPPKRKKYAVRLEEGFDVEKVIDRLLEGHNDLMTLKEILTSAPRLRDELKGRLSRRLVPNVHLGTILPKEAEWAELGTKMDWKCVACGTVDFVVKGSKCATMVDTGAEMNIIREADAIRFGLDIDRSDCGILHGASCKAVFYGTASNVLIEVGKVKARACFFIMLDVDHGILLGRSFLSRTETVIFNKHDGTLILLLCDPTCGNYEIITCRNTGPRSIKNRPNPGSFTIEESEGGRWRFRAEPEAGERVEAFSLSLSDVGKAMDLVAAHEMADPDAIHALREQVLECPEAGRLELVYRLPGSGRNPASAQTQSWMMELALASSHSLVEDMRTIEEGPGQVERYEDLMGGMYLLVNTLLQEGLDQSGLLNAAENVDEVPESQDDEFEEGEIKEAFCAEEYDGIYLELGLLLSCEMRFRDASDKAQRMLQRYLVRDGHLFVRGEVGNPGRVVCDRNRLIDVVVALHDGIAGGYRGVQATYAKISELYYWDGMMDMVRKFCRSCEHGEQAEEVPREEVSREKVPQEEVPREEMSREEVQDTQRERGQGNEGRREGKEVIEVGEDTPPQMSAVGLRLGDAPGSTRQAGEKLQREEALLPSSEKAPSPEGRAERRRERAIVRKEASTLIDRHLAAYALEHPDLEEPTPVEPRQESCHPEKEMEAEIPKRVDLRTRERAPAGETAEEKKARRTRRIDEIWQERQRLKAAGELPEQEQERQRSEAAGALPGQPPSAPARALEIPEMWRDFWEQRGEELPSPVRVGFGVTRKAEERLDRKIKFLAKTTFDRHLLLESDLAGKKMKESPQEPPMGRVILEPKKARAQRKAEREAFEFRAPTELVTLPVAAADPVVPLAVEEGRPPSSSEPAQGSAEGSMGVFLEAVHTMQEEVSLFSPEQRIEEPLEREMGIEAEGAIEGGLQRMGTPEYGPEEIEEQPMAVPGKTLERRPQRLDTPEYVPATGDLRSRLGSWATGSGSGGPVLGIEQQEVISTAVPRSEQHGIVSSMVGSPSQPPPQPKKKKFKRKVDQLYFYCKRGLHLALDCLEFLEDKVEGKVSKAGGKMYDKQGRIVEKSADGLRAQLYRQNQEELRR
ncbi:hypothetical protein CBR_g23374 [Chara braunii]|uniref:Integrase zinc-binding domain-containing protein n=1 Tax=Chara braunii TaxID=69332 RepID=A0A388L479_CHABU|nr:hypothetical protein CBR_g23374 [Chara braunii]|eukprot:GBG77048.1 hypothetical protein CBR_g23374 [Chara braunii]